MPNEWRFLASRAKSGAIGAAVRLGLQHHDPGGVILAYLLADP